jgi:hypothetical protein
LPGSLRAYQQCKELAFGYDYKIESTAAAAFIFLPLLEYFV